jgi:hypothetical protein
LDLKAGLLPNTHFGRLLANPPVVRKTTEEDGKYQLVPLAFSPLFVLQQSPQRETAELEKAEGMESVPFHAFSFFWSVASR